jgi:hypothetical protein
MGVENDRRSTMQKAKTMSRYAAIPAIDPGPKTMANAGAISIHIEK